MALNLSGAFPFEVILNQGCSGVLLCKDTSQYLVEISFKAGVYYEIFELCEIINSI